jgi:TrkA domain protein
MGAERIRLPADSPVAGRSLAETALRSRTGALVLSVSRGAREIPTPPPTFRFAADDVLVVVGQPPHIEAARRFLTGADGSPGV